MLPIIYYVLAASPLLLIVGLLLLLRRPLVVAAPVTLAYTIFLSFAVWHIEHLYAQAAAIKGVLIALDILLIIFGAILFLQVLKRTNVIVSIENYLCSISADHRIQVILLAWFFLSFIEGTSGFGTPMALIAPLLVAIGIPAMLAVSLALIGVGTSVAFGAVGTPMRVGLAGLAISEVPFYTGLISLFAGILIPVFLVWILVRYKPMPPDAFREILPFALWSGVCLTVPYFLASFLGKEFPSLIGPLVGGLVVICTTKQGWFVPKRVWRIGTIPHIKQEPFNVLRTVTPYAAFIVMLGIGKLFFSSAVLHLAPESSHTIEYFNPILAFLVGILVFGVAYRIPFTIFAESTRAAGKALLKPLVVIFCISTLVQLMILSGHNESALPGMLVLLTGWLATSMLPLISPFIGVFGAFISGSATVSNLLFANVQYKAAQTLGMNSQIILAEQTIGGGVGNTVSLTDIAVVQATVQLHDEERAILKTVIVPTLIYASVVGVLGLILVWLI